MEFIDYYQVLCIEKNASGGEIKKAYHKLAWTLHPDLNPNDENAIAKFQQLNEAYTVLSRPENREKYDKYGKYWNRIEVYEKYQQHQSSTQHPNASQQTYGNFNGKDLFAFFSSMFGQGSTHSEPNTEAQLKGRKKIMVQCITSAPVHKVWKYFSEARHLEKWNFASNDWHCPHVENDLTINGKFICVMGEKNGTKQFEYSGTYIDIIPEKLIKYRMDDGRKVAVVFSKQGYETEIIQTFEAENNISIEDQQMGWQIILNNFKAYCEDPLTAL